MDDKDYKTSDVQDSFPEEKSPCEEGKTAMEEAEQNAPDNCDPMSADQNIPEQALPSSESKEVSSASNEAEDSVRKLIEQVNSEVNTLASNSTKLSTEMRELHRLYHNEFAGRLRSMQDELERYHEIDRGRIHDGVLGEIARIYSDNEQLIDSAEDPKVRKRIRYLFMDIEQLLESNGVSMIRSEPGSKRNVRFSKIVDKIETSIPELHDKVFRSRSTGFSVDKRPLVKELIDVYIYNPGHTEQENDSEEKEDE